MSAHREQCAMCDRILRDERLSLRGWCPICENEFARVFERWECGIRQCKTPISCAVAGECQKDKPRARPALKLVAA